MSKGQGGGSGTPRPARVLWCSWVASMCTSLVCLEHLASSWHQVIASHNPGVSSVLSTSCIPVAFHLPILSHLHHIPHPPLHLKSSLHPASSLHPIASQIPITSHILTTTHILLHPNIPITFHISTTFHIPIFLHPRFPLYPSHHTSPSHPAPSLHPNPVAPYALLVPPARCWCHSLVGFLPGGRCCQTTP